MRSRRTKCCQHRRIGAPRTWRLRSSSTAVSSSLRAVPRPLPRVVAGTPRFARRPRLLLSLCFAQGALSLFPLRRARSARSAPSVPSFAVVALAVLAASVSSAPLTRHPAVPPSRHSLPRSRSARGLSRAGRCARFPALVCRLSPPRKNSLRSSAGWWVSVLCAVFDTRASRIVAPCACYPHFTHCPQSSHFRGINRYAHYSTFGIDKASTH